MFSAAMEGDIKLFKEMRKIKTGKGQMEEMAETVDGSTGEQQIAETFANIFKTLYNSSESGEEMKELQDRIQRLVGTGDRVSEILKVTTELVKQAACSLKPHKMDVSQGFSSDALLNGPDVLFEILASIFHPTGQREQGPGPVRQLLGHRRQLPPPEAI